MPYFDVKEILSTAITIIDDNGYISSKTSKNSTWATWKLVDKFITDHAKDLDEDDVNYLYVPIKDESIEIIKWVKSQSDISQYMSTVKEVINRGYCGKRLFGLLTSLVPIYRERANKRK